ncbi:MAG: gamma-glutamylcyclotransferase family protein [Pseudomonadota bacterium]
MLNALFVYGTLAPGRPNEHILAPLNGTWTPATLQARLIKTGWAVEIGYPALALDDDGPGVEGFVFESSDLADHWGRLDAFEGSGYQRILCKPVLNNGTVMNTYVYASKQDG